MRTDDRGIGSWRAGVPPCSRRSSAAAPGGQCSSRRRAIPAWFGNTQAMRPGISASGALAVVSEANDPLHGERGRLFVLAYRMLGSVGDAEDIVQEAYLRWHAQPRPEVREPKAYLTTIVTRLCLDHLKSASNR